MATLLKSLLLSVLLVSSNALAQTYTDDATFGNFHLLELGATPSSPQSGSYSIYPKSDGKLYLLNSSGVETRVGGGSASEVTYDNSTSLLLGTTVQDAIDELKAGLDGIDLSSKEDAISTGTTSQYWRGDKAWTDFATSVRASALTGLDTSSSAAITSSDTVLSSLGKLQGQENADSITLSTVNTSLGSKQNGIQFKDEGSSLGSKGTTASVNFVGSSVSATNSSDDITVTVNGIPNSTVTTKGDLLVGTASSTVSRLGAGTNGQVLVADSAQTAGIKWGDAASGGSGGINLEANNDPDISSGVSNWSSTGTTPSYVTTGTGIGIFDSKGYLSWDSAAAGEEICLPAVSVDSLASNNGQLLVYSRVPSGTATHEFRIYDGAGNLLKSLPITSTTTPYPNSTNLPFPTTGNTLEFCVHAIAANEPSIDIDHIYLGQTTNITSVENISDWTDFPSVAAGTLITATTTNPTYGTVATNKARWRRVGTNMEIEWDFKQTSAGSAGSGIYLFNLPPGYVIDTSKKTANTSTTYGGGYADGAVGKIDTNYSAGSGHGGAYVYSSTQLKFDMLLYNGGANGGAWHNGGGADFSYASQDVHIRASVPIQGWSTNQSAAAANQTDYGRTSYTPTFTGLGTVTNIDCYHSRTNQFLDLDCKFTAGTTTATEARVSLPNSLVPDVASIRRTGDVSISGTTAGEFQALMESSNSYITFGLQGASNAGLTKLNGSSFVSSGISVSFNAHIPIVGWTSNNKAPTLIDSVTARSTTWATGFDYGYVGGASDGSACTSSPCTLYRNTPSITSVTRTSSGIWVVNYSAYSQKPQCFATAAESGSNCFKTSGTTTTQTTVTAGCNASGGGVSDIGFNIFCYGAR